MKQQTKACKACGLARPATEDFCPRCTAPPAVEVARPRAPTSVVDTGLESRWGGGAENPTTLEMRAALAELDTPDAEHPSTWLSDQDGWTVDAYESGLVIFSNAAGEVCRKEQVARGDVLALWVLLQQARRKEIAQRLTNPDL